MDEKIYSTVVSSFISGVFFQSQKIEKNIYKFKKKKNSWEGACGDDKK